jgi:DNA-binding response OmpR family regulator
VLDVIQKMLQKTGCRVTLATDGHRALAKAMCERFSLIIVDRSLDGEFTGIDLVERLRKYGIRTPIIGTAPERSWQTPTASGEVDCFLSSPFGYGELINAAESLLNCSLAPSVSLDELASEAQDLEDLPELPDLAPELDLSGPEPAQPEPESRPAADPRMNRSPAPAMEAVGHSRILLLDHDDDDRESLAEDLIAAGFQVTPFKGGQDAYEDTMLNDYDLILTDLWVMGMDGFEVIDAMRKSGVTAPIAVITAYITREMVTELLESHVCKVFLKPVTLETLLSFVRETVPAS